MRIVIHRAKCTSLAWLTVLLDFFAVLAEISDVVLAVFSNCAKLVWNSLIQTCIGRSHLQLAPGKAQLPL